MENKHLNKMRNLNSSNIGQLVQLKGIVIRASNVNPCGNVISYTCLTCG